MNKYCPCLSIISLLFTMWSLLAGKAAGGLPIPHNADKEMNHGDTFSTSNQDPFFIQ